MSTAFTQFLASSKQKYLNDIHTAPSRASEWTVVMGNEAGDLDTVASSIAYAYFCSTHGKTPSVPLLQVDRADLSLRAENVYALSLAGITDPVSQLLCLSDIPLDINTPFPSNKFALVDHNKLDTRYSAPSAVVTAIIDHHADENQHPTANPRTVEHAGSCSSLVTRVLVGPTSEGGGAQFDIPEELATLLLCAILIDTSGLKPKGKALPVDIAAVFHLLPRSSLASSTKGDLPLSINDIHPPVQLQQEFHAIPSVQQLTATLDSKKFDLSHMSAYDNLRRDYKEYTYEIPPAASQSNGMVEIKAGLSTVPLPLEAEWTANEQLLKSATDWMTTRDTSILGVLTTFHSDKPKKNGKGKHKREMAWFVRSSDSIDLDALSEKLFSGLEADQDLELKKHKFGIDVGDRHDLRVRVYKQKNVDVSRKEVAPLLQRIMIVEGARS
ncbi:hypothetical protein APHAL10511_007954 [Amanita phalloides]|nr:hypothetical protein APHAL10511_007954 [Amanita phalloides]